MFTVPAWLSNVLLMVTCYISFYQHVQLKRPNPVMNLQFAMIVFSLVLMLIITFQNRRNPWLSLGFFLIAASSLATMVRQFRVLPPNKRFESL